jgi:hypothetical protein
VFSDNHLQRFQVWGCNYGRISEHLIPAELVVVILCGCSEATIALSHSLLKYLPKFEERTSTATYFGDRHSDGNNLRGGRASTLSTPHSIKNRNNGCTVVNSFAAFSADLALP